MSSPDLLNTRLSWILLGLLLFFVGCKPSEDKGYTPSEKPPETSSDGPFPFSYDLKRQFKIGPEACAECHHAKANRPVSLSKDREAFVPAQRIEESGVIYEMTELDGKFVMHVIDDDTIKET